MRYWCEVCVHTLPSEDPRTRASVLDWIARQVNGEASKEKRKDTEDLHPKSPLIYCMFVCACFIHWYVCSNHT